MIDTDRIFRYILSKHRLILLSIIILTIPMTYFFSRQTYENNLDIYFEKDDPDLLAYKKFQVQYGNDEMIFIVFKKENIFTIKNVALVRELSASLRELKGVQRVFSIADVEEALAENDTIRFRKMIPEGDNALDAKTLENVKHRMLGNRAIVNSLISQDGTTTTIAAELKGMPLNKKKDVLTKIRETAELVNAGRADLRFAGTAFIETRMNDLSQRDFWIFTPVTLAMIFVVMLVLVRNIKLTILCQVNMLITVFWSIGLFVMCGESFNLITDIMGATLLAIAVEDSVHILSEYNDEFSLFNDPELTIANTLRRVWFPCLFTSLTNAVGFVTFSGGKIRPTRILGIYTAIGVVIAYILSFVLIPALLSRYGKKIKIKVPPRHEPDDDHRSHDRFLSLIIRFFEFGADHYRMVNLILVVITAFSIIGISRIKFETNMMNYLPENESIKGDVEFVEKNLGGTVPFVMLISAKSDADNFTKPKSLRMLDEVQKHLMEVVPQFTTCVSIVDYIKEIHRAFNNGDEGFYAVPENTSDISDYYELGEEDVLTRLISEDRNETRISFQSKWDTNETAQRMHTKIESYMMKKLGDQYTYKITGLSAMYVGMEINLKESQIMSFIPAFLMISVMMFFICRTLPLTIISLIPNLFPIYVSLGLMGWFGIPLDVATIMIANVVIGIAVDDTIHIMVWFRRHIAAGMDYRSAITRTFRDCGKSITITSIVLFLGFMVLSLGSLTPTRVFGVLTALSMLLAIIGEIFTSSLIMQFKPRVPTKKGWFDNLLEYR
ncbi:MAG: MMPL family transporter [Proteobacteria bacterium]|nr:MMPL family transporter [Pseudomonadota bacterium]